MNERTEEKRYEGLSPFGLKNKLIAMSQSHHERSMLNAGRGNPNWLTPQWVPIRFFWTVFE